MVFEIARDCIFDVAQAHSALRHIVEIDWNSDGTVWWLPYSAVDCIASDNIARELSGGKRCLDYVVISVPIDIVGASLLVVQAFYLDDTLGDMVAALGSFEEVEERESGDDEDII